MPKTSMVWCACRLQVLDILSVLLISLVFLFVMLPFEKVLPCCEIPLVNSFISVERQKFRNELFSHASESLRSFLPTTTRRGTIRLVVPPACGSSWSHVLMKFYHIVKFTPSTSPKKGTVSRRLQQHQRSSTNNQPTSYRQSAIIFLNNSERSVRSAAPGR